MRYMSNIKCGCGEFLLATKSGLICPHCANQFNHDELRTIGDLVEISVSSDLGWYEEHKQKFKKLEGLYFLGFDDSEFIDEKITHGFVDFGYDTPTHDQVVKLVALLDETVDDRVKPLRCCENGV